MGWGVGDGCGAGGGGVMGTVTDNPFSCLYHPNNYLTNSSLLTLLTCHWQSYKPYTL